MDPKKVLQLAKDNDVKFVDLLDRILKHSRTGMRRSVSSDRSAR